MTTSLIDMQIGLSLNSAAFQVPPDASNGSYSMTRLRAAEAALSNKNQIRKESRIAIHLRRGGGSPPCIFRSQKRQGEPVLVSPCTLCPPGVRLRSHARPDETAGSRQRIVKLKCSTIGVNEGLDCHQRAADDFPTDRVGAGY